MMQAWKKTSALGLRGHQKLCVLGAQTGLSDTACSHTPAPWHTVWQVQKIPPTYHLKQPLSAFLQRPLPTQLKIMLTVKENRTYHLERVYQSVNVELWDNAWITAMPIICRRKWQPVPVFLPGKSHGPRSLVGYSPEGLKESETTEHAHNTHTCHTGYLTVLLLYIKNKLNDSFLSYI